MESRPEPGPQRKLKRWSSWVICTLLLCLSPVNSSGAEVPLEFQWVAAAYGATSCEASSVVADPLGNVYVAFNAAGGKAFFGTNVVEGDPVLFGGVARFDADEIAWVTPIPGPKGVWVSDVDLGPSGDLFVCGARQPANSLPNGQFTLGFIARLRADGSIVWLRDQPGRLYTSLAIDPSGRVIAGGATSATRALVASFDLDGTAIWSQLAEERGFENPFQSWISAVGVSAAGDVFAAGAFEGEIPRLSTPPFASEGDFDAFIWEMRRDGSPLRWLRGGGTLYDAALTIASSPGGFFVGGETISTNSSFGFGRVAMNGEGGFLTGPWKDGTPLSARSRADAQAITGLAADAEGNLFVAAALNPLLSKQSFSISKLDPSGERAWEVVSSGDGFSRINAVALDGFGNPFICGSFQKEQTFGTIKVGGGGLGAMFVAKLGLTARFTSQPESQIVRQGEDVEFRTEAIGSPPMQFQWFKADVPIAGATNAVLSIANAQPSDSAAYTVSVANPGRTNVSSAATLVVIPEIPVTVSTIAGTGVAGFVDATDAESAQFNSPTRVVVDRNGTVFIADRRNNCIRFLTGAGLVHTVAGQPPRAGFQDGPASAALFHDPVGLFATARGELLVVDNSNNRLRRIAPITSPIVATAAGTGVRGFRDGATSVAAFDNPYDVAQDSQGNIYITDVNNHVVRKLSPSGTVSTFAGNGRSGYADGAGNEARFNKPAGITIDTRDTLYVVDSGNNRIRKITLGGQVTTVAGTNTSGFADGPGDRASFLFANGIAADRNGNLFVTDAGNHAVRMITPEGVVTTLAGTGRAGFADGTKATARFAIPVGIAIDHDGALIVADSENHRLRRIAFGSASTNRPSSTLAMLFLEAYPSLTIRGSLGRTYRIDASDEAGEVSWKPLTNVVVNAVPFRWVDPQPARNAKRIYRAVLVP